MVEITIELKKSPFMLPKVAQQHFVGEVGTFIFFQYRVSSGLCTNNYFKIFIELFRKQGSVFRDTLYKCVLYNASYGQV